MRFRRWLNRYGLLVVLGMVVLLSIAAFYWHWTDSQKLIAVTGLAVTAILAAITWQYLRTTQASLDLLREQWKYQQAVEIQFGVKKKLSKPWIRIANTGGVRLFVSKVVFRQRGKPTFTRNTIRTIGEGQNYGFYIPSTLYKDQGHWIDVDITIHYQAYGRNEETVSRAFRIMFLSGKVAHINRGVHDWWRVPCPKCGVKNIMMNTDDLENHDAAYKREAELKDQLRVTCPQHQSPWLETVEAINERQKRNQSEIED